MADGLLHQSRAELRPSRRCSAMESPMNFPLPNQAASTAQVLIALTLASGIVVLFITALAHIVQSRPESDRGKAQAAVLIDDTSEFCSWLGYREGTEGFEHCVIRWRRARP